MKKHIIKALLGVTLLGGTSCNLDFKPLSDLPYVGFWEKEEATRAGYTGVVERFRAYGNSFFTLGELRADGWGGISMESPWNIDARRNQYSATTAPYGNWGGFYGLLHYINDFLNNAEKSTFDTPSDRDNMMAQVYGMRAFVYYTMLKTWGDVILTDKPLTSDQIKNLESLRRKRNSKAEVMAFILADIEKSLEYYAKPGVKETWKNSSVYWSKAATLTLKGDALLWKGEVLAGGEADFRAAKAALESIAGLSKKYSLVPYERLWGAENENNSEFIFAYDYKKDEASHFYSGTYAARAVDLTGKFSQDGSALSAENMSGGNHDGPSDELLRALYAQEDKRQATFALVFDNRNPRDLTTLNNRTPGYKGAILRKFWGRLESDGTRLRDENVPLYRYADVLLLLAEAKNQLGEDPSDEINQIRQRAGFATAYSNQSKIDNKRAILDERFKEFVGEGKRWWDLIRAGDGLLFEYVKATPATEAYRIYLPISNQMIAADPEYITQTEGY